MTESGGDGGGDGEADTDDDVVCSIWLICYLVICIIIKKCIPVLNYLYRIIFNSILGNYSITIIILSVLRIRSS